MPARIPLDPKLRAQFDNTPNDERSKAELDAWWDHPYGVTREDGTIAVRCLDGGAWDRSTSYGIAPDYEAACALAAAKLADWLRMRERPSFMIDEKVMIVRMAQRPDQSQTLICEFDTSEEAAAYMAEHYGKA